jgi:hypothetical protein
MNFPKTIWGGSVIHSEHFIIPIDDSASFTLAYKDVTLPFCIQFVREWQNQDVGSLVWASSDKPQGGLIIRIVTKNAPVRMPTITGYHVFATLDTNEELMFAAEHYHQSNLGYIFLQFIAKRTAA